ncbi:hypothetical protein IMG5_042050 [Ichthyophthirius multifiliis]|uniref:Transmembrane protein n=1 Tax=Ichthyophthirius multifiliis TaxID=5932 RepID=G0QM25_ICHMU|nr:hypothetical protein IMG5_042050 [Ichthyophthirius multifiliis]EGR33729.1 hypothetical protein IMG5_042050 [Ichthyophthirius multifiliis]|eukprot:XP_004037715.1 hypothetical protein IMG5_042050 [Ichthyophthirius multifiliis]
MQRENITIRQFKQINLTKQRRKILFRFSIFFFCQKQIPIIFCIYFQFMLFQHLVKGNYRVFYYFFNFYIQIFFVYFQKFRLKIKFYIQINQYFSILIQNLLIRCLNLFQAIQFYQKFRYFSFSLWVQYI